MKANVRSSSSLGLLVVVVILLNGHCRGIIAVKSNGTYRSCNGPMDDCFIIDVGMEVLLDTEINLRLLAPGGNNQVQSLTENANNANSAAANCGQGKPYSSCHPSSNPRKTPPKCPENGIYEGC